MNPEQQRQQHREVARLEGYRAGADGHAIGLNPYRDDDPLWHEWRESWQYGAAERAR